MVRSPLALRCSREQNALHTLIRHRHLTPSCGGRVPTAERTLDPARMFMESLTTGPELENSQGHQRHFERPPAISACPQFQTSCCPEANDVSGPEADQVRIGTRLVAAIERRHVPQSNRMKILVAMFQRTADTLRAAPTPITEPVTVWVVEHRRDSGGKTKDRATQSRARRIRTTGAWERSLPG